MPDYMLLLHETPELRANLTSGDMQKIVAQFVEWRTTLTAQGKLSAGHRLRQDPGRVITSTGGSGGVEVKDGPYTETKDVIGGFFLLSASGYDEAASLASTCPHVLLGGRIELREVEPRRR